MAKQEWKPGNMLYPLPAVLVSMADREGRSNIITVAWCATVCTNPPMLSISVRPDRYSYPILKETGEFVVNLTTEELAFATDYCGVRSGRDVDKFKEMHLTKGKGIGIAAPHPLYVLETDSQTNTVYVGAEKELYSSELELSNIHLSYDLPNNFDALVKIRYNMNPIKAFIKIDKEIEITFKDKISAIAPGQACVIYDIENGSLLGGSFI